MKKVSLTFGLLIFAIASLTTLQTSKKLSRFEAASISTSKLDGKNSSLDRREVKLDFSLNKAMAASCGASMDKKGGCLIVCCVSNGEMDCSEYGACE